MNGNRILRFACQQPEQDHWPLRLIDKTCSFLDSSNICRTSARVHRWGENVTPGRRDHDVHGQTHKGCSWAVGLCAAKRIHFLISQCACSAYASSSEAFLLISALRNDSFTGRASRKSVSASMRR